ncbi:MAG: exopolyphosphatase [Lachnospiraceae bacterium]|nr:exopolyphosphatase [Lachnospiraceae bacterium]
MKIFAAIDVGSYEIGMKIFQMSKKYGMKEIDYIRHRIDLGTDTYTTGKISYDHMEELCEILKGFTGIMESYRVDAYRAYGTSAIRETRRTDVVLDQIHLRTGLSVEVLSNSEQRFLDYKSVALKGGGIFDKIIHSGTIFVDIGGGSTQVSIFRNAGLITTVNLRLGILKIRERLTRMEPRRSQYDELLSEIIENELHSLRKLYLQDMDIRNIIVVDDYLPYILHRIGERENPDFVTSAQYLDYLEKMKLMNHEEVSKLVGIPPENSSLLMPSATFIQHFINSTNAEKLWIPGVSLSDGIAYDYAERTRIIETGHDFDRDILTSADQIAARYRCSQTIIASILQVSLAVFDSMKKFHGLNRRARLLLELSARLRECGSFISVSAPAESAYSIIMGTEIIGLSHKEREMVALSVLESFPGEAGYTRAFNSSDETFRLTVVKLSAILRLSSGLAINPRKKYRSVRAAIKERELIITVESAEETVLERFMALEGAKAFEEVFGIRPVIKSKMVT